MSVIVSKIPIIADSKKLYKSCTSDDKLMYFISDDSNEIDIFDSDYCYVSKIQIENNYLNITYKKED
ncbi:MAG: hypothetical protein RRZ68_08190, partial [Oscillospiraceae bacterium]